MKILFATDGAAQSDAAIKILSRFNLDQNDEIKVISVVDMAVPMSIDIYGGYIPDTTELEKTAREHASRILEETAGKFRGFYREEGPSLTTDVLFGSPDSRIVETAEEIAADLVVVGSHGYSRWERLLLGSVSDSVVHHSPCSVLVVRTPPAE